MDIGSRLGHQECQAIFFIFSRIRGSSPKAYGIKIAYPASGLPEGMRAGLWGAKNTAGILALCGRFSIMFSIAKGESGPGKSAIVGGFCSVVSAACGGLLSSRKWSAARAGKLPESGCRSRPGVSVPVYFGTECKMGQI